jgi:hypothetical protein
MTNPILVSGDSYSLEWPKQFAKLIRNPITNISSQGRSNLFVWSSAINYLTKVDTKHIVIVGNSFITRTDTWVENQINKKTWDEVQHPERKNGNLSMPLQHFNKKYEEWFRTSDICTLWQEYYYDLFCFAHTLKSLGHDFFLFNAARNLMGDPELDFNFRGYLINTPYYNWCHSQPNILPGDTFSIPDWCKENNVKTSDTGHIKDDEGCLVFSKWLHKQLLQLKLF